MAAGDTKKKPKTLYYRRANWRDQKGKTLQAAMLEMLEKSGTMESRSLLDYNGNIIRAEKYESVAVNSSEAVFVHLTKHAPGEMASVIDRDNSKPESEVGTTPAPKDKEYMDCDLFALIKGNHVVICPSGAREKVLETYILGLASKQGKEEMIPEFSLEKIAKADKVEMINREGVKEIRLKTSLYKASMLELEHDNSSSTSLSNSIADGIARFFSKDESLREIKEGENLNVSLGISFDGRQAQINRKKSPDFGKDGRKRLQDAAEILIDDFERLDDGADGFTIVTNQGNEINSEQIRVSDKVRIQSHGKSVHFEGAKIALKAFLSRLEENGILSQ